MRCLVVSDLHYALPQFDWLAEAAPKYELVVFAGDALDVASYVDFGAQTLVVRKYFQRVAKTTRFIFCSGNHDLDSRSPDGEKVARWVSALGKLGVACDGDAIVVDDALYSVFPWWDGPVVKERLIAQLGPGVLELLFQRPDVIVPAERLHGPDPMTLRPLFPFLEDDEVPLGVRGLKRSDAEVKPLLVGED